jgi:hypothetical protein
MAPPAPRLSCKEGGEAGGSGKNIVLRGLGRRLWDAEAEADADVDVDGIGTPRRGL